MSGFPNVRTRRAELLTDDDVIRVDMLRTDQTAQKGGNCPPPARQAFINSGMSAVAAWSSAVVASTSPPLLQAFMQMVS